MFIRSKVILWLFVLLAVTFFTHSLSITQESVMEKDVANIEERVLEIGLESVHKEGLVKPLVVTDVPTAAPTLVPTRSPTKRPTRKPTRRPTIRKSIYGDYQPDEVLDYSDQQNTVAILIVAIFVCMAFEVAAPEVIMLIALMIVIFCEILTLSDGLAGRKALIPNFYSL